MILIENLEWLRRLSHWSCTVKAVDLWEGSGVQYLVWELWVLWWFWMKNVPHSLRYLNTWSPVGGSVWRSWGNSLAAESLSVATDFEIKCLDSIHSLCFLWALSILSCPHDCHLLLCFPTMVESKHSRTIAQTHSVSYESLWLWVSYHSNRKVNITGINPYFARGFPWECGYIFNPSKPLLCKHVTVTMVSLQDAQMPMWRPVKYHPNRAVQPPPG